MKYNGERRCSRIDRRYDRRCELLEYRNQSNEDYQETIRELRREIENIHGWYEEKLQNFVEGVKWTPMDERTDGNHKEK